MFHSCKLEASCYTLINRQYKVLVESRCVSSLVFTTIVYAIMCCHTDTAILFLLSFLRYSYTPFIGPELSLLPYFYIQVTYVAGYPLLLLSKYKELLLVLGTPQWLALLSIPTILTVLRLYLQVPLARTAMAWHSAFNIMDTSMLTGIPLNPH